MTSFSKALKTLSLTKDDMSEIQALCGWENKEEFSDSEMETLTEIVQRKSEGAGSYAVAYEQMQTEVVPVEAEPVAKRTEVDNLIDQVEEQAVEDYQRAQQKLGQCSEEVDMVVVTAYLHKLNSLFKQGKVQRATLEQPDELAKKPGPLMSRLNERLAAQAPVNQTALPASTTSLPETSSAE